jgi:hypothetical protein
VGDDGTYRYVRRWASQDISVRMATLSLLFYNIISVYAAVNASSVYTVKHNVRFALIVGLFSIGLRRPLPLQSETIAQLITFYAINRSWGPVSLLPNGYRG